ncbi:MAG TPA: AAA family ATPase [Isosphaeraceae bacterium]|jgi:pilus assembly protein CpaE|nr:AAA family ATPase [Isosphaeraceae bacterium]
MKGMIRVVLVDPLAESRQVLQGLLGGLNGIWLAEVCASYAEATRSIAEHLPDLAVIVLDADPEAAIGLMQSIYRARPDAVILPAGRPRNSELILRVVRAGAREFLLLPAEVDDLLQAIDRLVRPGADSTANARRAGQVIALAGAAGGVGCTTLAVNLAVALAEAPEATVAVADLDLLFGSVDTCLDILPDRTLLDVTQSVERLDLPLLKRSLTRHASGIYILPRPAAMEDVSKVDLDSLRRAITLLKAGFQTIILDTSKGLQATDFVAYETADTILLVVEFDLVCLRNSARLLQLFRQFEGLADKVRVVVNRLGSQNNEIGLKKAEETLGVPVSWQVPNAFRPFSAARAQGVPLATVAAGSRPHRAFQEMARTFQPCGAAAEAGRERKGMLSNLFSRRAPAPRPEAGPELPSGIRAPAPIH